MLLQLKYKIPDVLQALYIVRDGQHVMDDLTPANRMLGAMGYCRVEDAVCVIPPFSKAAVGMFESQKDAEEAYYASIFGRLRIPAEEEEMCLRMGDPRYKALHPFEPGLRHGYFTFARSNLGPKSIVVDVRNTGAGSGAKVLKLHKFVVCRIVLCRITQHSM
jgi:hypothetical protein